jgi:hypothetical protein
MRVTVTGVYVPETPTGAPEASGSQARPSFLPQPNGDERAVGGGTATPKRRAAGAADLTSEGDQIASSAASVAHGSRPAERDASEDSYDQDDAASDASIDPARASSRSASEKFFDLIVTRTMSMSCCGCLMKRVLRRR